MAKYVPRPEAIDAVQFDGTESSINAIAALRYPAHEHRIELRPFHGELLIPTLDGTKVARKYDYVIWSLVGGYRVMSEAYFESQYLPQ